MSCSPNSKENTGPAKLEGEDYLRGGDPADFASRLAERWADLTAIHPFRDGNTRSQSAGVSLITERAGQILDWKPLDVDQLRRARLAAVVGQMQPLTQLLASRLSAIDAD